MKGKPIAVCQYTQNAGIIAVNYPARALGISRHMRESEARAACKELIIVKVASKHGKADISKYRDAGCEVAKVFMKFTNLLERASIDEAYLDITDNVAERMKDMRDKKFQMQAPHFVNTHAVGYNTIGNFIQDVSAAVDQSFAEINDEDRASFSSSKLRLLVGGTIVNDIRKAVFEETGYTCSAGIAHNKILAKLVCGMNKPNKQTILPLDSIHGLFEKLEISKIKSMGGKIGEEVCQKLNVKVVNDLLKFSENELKHDFGDRIGSFLFLIARGIDLEKVRLKIMSKSIGVSKNFLGASEIKNINTLKYWLLQLSEEVKERLESDSLETNRVARQLTVQFTQFINGKSQSFTRTVQLFGNILNTYTQEEIATECYETIEKNSPKFLKLEGKCLLNYGIRHLGITAGKFEDTNSSNTNIQDFFSKKPKSDANNDDKILEQEEVKDDNKAISDDKSEHTEELPIIRVKSEHELKGTFKQFERDPQACTPVACEESLKENQKNPEEQEEKFEKVTSYESDDDIFDLSNENLQNLFEGDFKAFKNFSGDNSIRGLKTLKFWICELFRDVDKMLSANNETNRAPEELEFNFTQTINGTRNKFTESIPLFVLSNNVISADFIIDTLKETSSDFMLDDNIINPITFLEIKAKSFKDDAAWKLKLYEDNIQKKFEDIPMTQEIPMVTQNEIEPTAVDDQEEIALLEQSFLESKMHDDPKPSTSKDGSYLESYVELNSGITLDDLNPLEECQECGKMIRKFDMLTHNDAHIAMKLAQELREEYRAEKKQSVPSSQKPVPSSSFKFKTKSVKPKENFPSIEKFTKKREENASEDSEEEKVICDDCGKAVKISEYIEHKDHHYAQKIRIEQMNNNSLKSNESNKRKRPTSNSTSSQKKMKSVKDFLIKE